MQWQISLSQPKRQWQRRVLRNSWHVDRRPTRTVTEKLKKQAHGKTMWAKSRKNIRHHVVIHYVVTYCFSGFCPAMFFRHLPGLVFSAFGPAMFFLLLAHIVFQGQPGPKSYCFFSFPVSLFLGGCRLENKTLIGLEGPPRMDKNGQLSIQGEALGGI